MQMMPSALSGPWVYTDLRGWEYPLPSPLSIGVGILSVQSVGQVDSAEALRHIVLVQLANLGQMCRQRLFHGGGQYGDPIFVALPLTNQDLVASEVNVLHSEP